MAARSLRCVAIAYRKCEVEKVPTDEDQLAGWVLPEDELTLLAIVGIKVHIMKGYHSACHSLVYIFFCSQG